MGNGGVPPSLDPPQPVLGSIGPCGSVASGRHGSCRLRATHQRLRHQEVMQSGLAVLGAAGAKSLPKDVFCGGLSGASTPARAPANRRSPPATNPPCRRPNGRRIPDPANCGAGRGDDLTRHPQSADRSPARRPVGVPCVLPWCDVTDAAVAANAHDADRSTRSPHPPAPASTETPPSQSADS